MLCTILRRKNEGAAEAQADARETGSRGYRDPIVRTVIAANRIYKRQHLLRNGA